MAMNQLSMTNWSTQPPTSDDRKIIYDFIFLPLVLTVIEHNRKQLDQKGRALRAVFARAADLVIAKVHADYSECKRNMLRHNISVSMDTSNLNSICYQYTCRSHMERITLSRSYIYTEINARISTYTAELFVQR